MYPIFAFFIVFSHNYLYNLPLGQPFWQQEENHFRIGSQKPSWKFQFKTLSLHRAMIVTLSKISMILVDWESKLLYFGKSYLNSVWIYGKLIYLLSGYFLFESDSFIQKKIEPNLEGSLFQIFRIFSAKVDLAFLIFSLAKLLCFFHKAEGIYMSLASPKYPKVDVAWFHFSLQYSLFSKQQNLCHFLQQAPKMN